MGKEAKPFYDLDKINDVPIRDVIASLGLEIEKKDWFKLREERTASCRINETGKYANTFKDYGGDQAFGGPITLVSIVNNCERYDAMKWIGETFGIEPEQAVESKEVNLSDYQWRKLGIYPELATANMDLRLPDTTGMSAEQAQEVTAKWAQAEVEPYRMPMNELAQKHPEQYYGILRERVLPSVKERRTDYESLIKTRWQLTEQFDLALNCTSTYEEFKGTFNEELSAEAKELTSMEKTLQAAIKDPSQIRFKAQVHDWESDFKRLVADPELLKEPDFSKGPIHERLIGGEIEYSVHFMEEAPAASMDAEFHESGQEFDSDLEPDTFGMNALLEELSDNEVAFER